MKILSWWRYSKIISTTACWLHHAQISRDSVIGRVMRLYKHLFLTGMGVRLILLNKIIVTSRSQQAQQVQEQQQ